MQPDRHPLLDDESIRLTAYFLWEQDGRPEGREHEYWLRAKERCLRQSESDLLLALGPPPDGEDPT
jgi:hypothetical protein